MSNLAGAGKRAAFVVSEFGIDPAWLGDSESALCIRKGRPALLVQGWRGLDTMEFADLTCGLAKEYKPRVMRVDATGVGAGVYDRLRAMQGEGRLDPAIIVEAVMWGGPARNSERFANLKAEHWWALHERVRARDISLPRDDLLARQLKSQEFTEDARGRIAIVGKEEMRRRGVPSPDRADAVVLAYAGVDDEKAQGPVGVGKVSGWPSWSAVKPGGVVGRRGVPLSATAIGRNRR